MILFRKKETTPRNEAAFPPDRYEPVLRASICTGEKIACKRDRESGALHEVMLVRSEADLEEFCRLYGKEKSDIRTVY